MPDPRPLPSLRSGAYDDPPASSEASTPQTRQQRLRRAILGTSELAQEVINMANTERQGRRSTVGGLTRRRQRSSSERDELSAGTHSAEDRRPGRRWTKRRRLNREADPPLRKPIQYGYYGRVEPGRLQLSLVSCDGGQHIDSRHPETSLGPENLLRHDRSVYCSERPQSNVILKHADDTPFCLEKLHIVGPDIGFTAPVRAGVVYVGMTLGELQKYLGDEGGQTDGRPPHARRSELSPYHDRFRRRRRGGGGRGIGLESPRSPSRSPELLSVAEALRDPYINAAHNSSRAPFVPDPGVEDVETDLDADPYCDSNPPTERHEHPRRPYDRQDSSNEINHPGARTQPVTILSDEDAGPEESSSQDVLDFRSQRERLMRRRFDIENWHRTRSGGTETGGEWEREREREAIATLPLSRLLARHRVRDSPPSPGSSDAEEEEEEEEEDEEEIPPLEPIPRAEPVPPQHQHQRQRENQHRLPAPHPDPVAHTQPPTPTSQNSPAPSIPTASFQLQNGKHKLAIKFDPPVSGRFLLLKLWAARGRDNVDVQSVVAYGFGGGGRFFPAVVRK